ncbi:twin-arginine translocase subunit TatB [Corynebacterium sp. ES2730-CONJ]|uniref:twin-arginine translocase subunit TatB n=1 Tax=Corynebacterium sp. ES2730-CONJ TaxID=2973941 RepID=UPI00216B3E50|nr:twin-arginine translocase subunit TatB [Corynebacterium sp. ES2730-CONJ]MCS4531871.1 twin-arginine translocase subunit TatB [Corynebacterium sp. ES2730-CONJ]
MFSSIGWGEIFWILILAMIFIGPEKLPGVIEDARAAIFAARRAINNAKAELNGEYLEEFEDFRAPINQIAGLQRMGPKAALTKVLFDGDTEAIDSLDLKKQLGELDSPTSAARTELSPDRQASQADIPNNAVSGPRNRDFSWDDVL